MIFKISNIKKTLLASACVVSWNSFSKELVEDIIIEGNKRIETATIREYIKIKQGDEYSKLKEDESLKSLYSTSLFEDISMDFHDGKLKVNIKEFPLITSIKFKGNSKLGENTIKKHILSTVGSSLSKRKLSEDIRNIKRMYKSSGRFSANVDAKIEYLPNSRVKIIFDIKEGPKTPIKKINFVGNINYSDSELKSIINTKESAWFRFMESSDTLDPQRIEQDKNSLVRFYKSVGYADFNVVSSIVELSKNKKAFYLTYNIEEGNRYKLGNISLVSDIDDINIKILRKLISTKKGQVYNASKIDDITDNLSDKIKSLGYSFVEVQHFENKNHESKTIDIEFRLLKANRVLINKIDIIGNVKTQDRVIRRELTISEGDVFNIKKIRKSLQNVNDLDFFESVTPSTVKNSDNGKIDLEIDVQEKSTSAIGLNLGYGSAAGGIAEIDFTERNFLGTGNYFNTTLSRESKKTSFSIGITNPKFLGRDLALGFSTNFSRSSSKSLSDKINKNPQDLTQSPLLEQKLDENQDKNKNYESHRYKSTGFGIFLSYDVSENFNHLIRYSLDNSKLIGNPDKTSPLIAEQIGKYTTSSIKNSFTYTNLDSRVLPKNGSILSLSQTFAGLGGNNKYLKHEASAKFLKSFYNNKITFKISGDAGIIKGIQKHSVRISDRFYLGDPIFRGFEVSGIGPRDKITGEALNGQKYYMGSAEVLFPLGLPEELNVSGAVFFDVGTLWDVDFPKGSLYNKESIHHDKSLRMSAGFGFIWVTKLAPLRIDYAFPLRKQKYDETQRIHFKFSAAL